MTEVVYVNTGADQTNKVRFGRGGREMEMEERGEPVEDTYLTPDDRDPIYVIPIDQDHFYETPVDLDPGTQ